MKKDILITINKDTGEAYLNNGILGVSNENLQGNIVFNFINGFVDGVASLEIEKPSGTKGYIQMTKNGEAYKLPILSSLLNERGLVNLQLKITQVQQGDNIPVFKSNVFYLNVKEAINSTQTIPEQYPTWLEIFQEKIAEINEAIDEVENLDITSERVADGVEITFTDKDGEETVRKVNDGAKGDAGVGVPTGGTTGQVLKKKSNTNYDTEWGTMDLSNYSLINETGNKIDLSIDSSTYVMTLVLKDKNNNVLSTGTIDLPLETMVVGATYDNVNKKIILTLKNGQTIDVAVGDLVSGLVPDTRKINNKLLSSDITLTPSDIGAVQDNNYVHTDNNYTTAEKTKLAGLSNYDDTEVRGLIANKQDIIQVEELPTASASNVGDIYEYVGTTGTYTNGYFYQCVDNSTQESITATQTDNVVPLGTITLNNNTLKSQLSAGTHEFVYRPYDTVLNFSNISVFPPVMIQVTRDNTFDRQPMFAGAPKMYSWVDGSNNFYVTDTLQPNALTKLYELDIRTNELTDTGCTFISSNTPSQLEGRWTKKTGDVYEDVELSDYGILLSSSGLPGNTIQVNYTEANTSYSWQQKNVQPSSGSSDLNIENGTGTNSLKQKGANALGTNSLYFGKVETFNVTIDTITISSGIPTIKVIYPEGDYQIKRNSILKITDENSKTALYYVTNRPDKGETAEDKRTLVLDNYTRTVSKGVDTSYTHTITTALTGTITVYNGIVALEDARAFGNFTNILDFAYPSIEGQTSSSNSISTGSRNIVTGSNSTAIGEYCVVDGDLAFAQGRFGKALGNQSTVEGSSCTAWDSNCHAEGKNSEAYGETSHAEGNANKSKGANSHTEGQSNTIETNGTNAHAEGYNNEVKGANSHAEGKGNKLQNDAVFCHAEGDNNLIKYNSQGCHIEGQNNTIEYANKFMHVGGHDNKVEPHSINGDFVHGGNLVARNENGYQTIFGQHNDRGIKVVKRFRVPSNRASGRLIVKIGNAFEAVFPEENMIVYSPKLVNLTTGLKVTEDMDATKTSKEVKKWRRTGSCSASSSTPEGCYGIKNFSSAWSIIDYIDDRTLDAGLYEISFYVLYGTLPFTGDFDIFVSHNGTTLTGSDYTYTNYNENGLFEVGSGDGVYNRKNAIRVNDLGQVIAGSAELSSTDDSATLVPRQYLDENYYKSSQVDANFLNKNDIKTSLSSGNDNVYSTAYINAQFNGVEPRGRITASGTMYEVVVSNVDAGTAGKITFVVEG